LSSVLGLDLEKYSVVTNDSPNASDSYLGAVPQHTIDYELASSQSKLKILSTFANDHLKMIQVLEKEGTPLTKYPYAGNPIELAKDFLSNCQKYAGDQIYGEFKSTLDDTMANGNINKTLGNTRLEIVVDKGITSFKWTYVANGATAHSKFVSLTIRDGFLTFFVDKWQLYKIGSTSVKLTKEDAVVVALEAAKSHFATLKLDNDTFSLKSFNNSNVRWTSLIFDGSLGANNTRSKDVLALYPVWKVGIALNSWYGQLYGITVDIWADNGEVRCCQEAWSTLPPPDEELSDTNTIAATANEINDTTGNAGSESPNTVAVESQLNNLAWLIFLALAVVALKMGFVCIRSKSEAHSQHLRKLRPVKMCGTLLSVLLLSSVFIGTIATVNATTPTGAAIWGARSVGGYDWNQQGDWKYWRKSYDEVYWQGYTATNLSSYFQANGYDAVNHQGASSSAAQIHQDIGDLQNTNARLAVVDFDHGVGLDQDITGAPDNEFHYMFEDDTGTVIGTEASHDTYPNHGVFDLHIYQETAAQPSKVFFAFINTCESASLDYQELLPPDFPYGERARGMPLAWTHRFVKDINEQGFDVTQHMSDEGYGSPDDGNQVYIGFPYGSASLEEPIPFDWDTGTRYYYWVHHFFYWALYYDMSVNAALNAASQDSWGYDFGSQYCPLSQGFTAYWWNGNPETMNDCTMAVYGNGKIHLKTFSDDFDDQNYNGWTVSLGTWSASSQKLTSTYQQGYSLIKTSNNLPTTDRYVRATMKTLSTGSNPWDVNWIMAKYVSGNDMVYGLIHINGYVELAIVRNGQKTSWVTPSGLSPSATHTIDIDTVGTRAYMWVDGTLYLDKTNDAFDDFGGSSAVYSHQSSMGEFDDISILNLG
jgi:hypothetical protein